MSETAQTAPSAPASLEEQGWQALSEAESLESPELLRRCSQLLEELPEEPGLEVLRGRAEVLCAIAHARKGEVQPAELHAQASLAACTTVGDEDAERALRAVRVRARARDVIGTMRLASGKLSEALGQLRDGLLELSGREQRAQREHASLINDVGRVFLQQRKHLAAAEHFQSALDIARALDDVRMQSSYLVNLGNCHSELGNYEGSLDCYRQALEFARRLGSTQELVLALGNLSEVESRLGRRETALELAHEAGELLDECQERHFTRDNIEVLIIDLLRKSGRLEEARLRAQRTLEEVRERGNVVHECAVLLSLAYVLRELGCEQSALHEYEVALALLEDVQAPALVQRAQLGLGRCHLQRGDAAHALGVLDALRADLEESGERTALLEVLPYLSEAHAQSGAPMRALEVFRGFHELQTEITRANADRRLQLLQLEAQRQLERARAGAEARTELEKQLEQRPLEPSQASEQPLRGQKPLEREQREALLGRLASRRLPEMAQRLTLDAFRARGPAQRARVRALQEELRAMCSLRTASSAEADVCWPAELLLTERALWQRLVGEQRELLLWPQSDTPAARVPRTALVALIGALLELVAREVALDNALVLQCARLDGGAELRVRYQVQGPGHELCESLDADTSARSALDCQLELLRARARVLGATLTHISTGPSGGAFQLCFAALPPVVRDSAPQRVLTASLTVLVLEPQRELSAQLALELEREGHRVLTAQDDLEALAWASRASEHIELVIADPGAQTDAGRSLQARLVGLLPDAHLVWTGLERPAAGWLCLPKPFGPSELSAMLEECCADALEQ